MFIDEKGGRFGTIKREETGNRGGWVKGRGRHEITTTAVINFQNRNSARRGRGVLVSRKSGIMQLGS